VAASQEQKVDYLLKKIGYSASKTGIAEDSSLSGTKKSPYEEPIPSPLIIPGTIIWSQSQNIPTTPPVNDTAYVKAYAPGITSFFQMTVDGTVSGNRTFVARQTVGSSASANVGDWVDTQFGSDYNIKVYKGNPSSGGVQLSAAGSGSNDTWFFDYSSGVLNFNGSSVPSGVSASNIFIVGYRYIGAKGVLSEGGQGQTNLSVANLNVSGIATVGVGFTGVKIDSVTGIITSTNPGVTTVTFVGNLIGTASTAGFAQTAFNLNSPLTTRVGFATTAIDVIGGIGSLTQLSVSGVTTVGVLTATRIGIGTTNPTAELFVVGNSRISGIVTVGTGSTGVVINGISGIITSSNPGVTTVTYFGNLTGTASTAGFAATAFKLEGFTPSTGSVGFATTATNVIGGIASVSQLSVSGFSTVGVLTATKIGIGTTNPTSELFVIGNSNISGVSTFGNTSIGVRIIGTSGIITSSSSGIGTVTYFGDGSNLTGIKGVSVEFQSQTAQTLFPTLAANSGVSSIGIVTTGSGTLSFNTSTGSLGIGTTNPTSKLTVNGNVLVSGIATIGIGSTAILLNGITGFITSSNPGVTTITYFGDGSKLTGIKGVTVEFQVQTAQTLFPTLAANSGVSSIGIVTTGSTAFCYIPSSGNIGIGTTTASSKLTVDGNVLVSGVTTVGSGLTGVVINSGIITSISGLTTVTFVGNLTGTATNVIGGIGSITQLSVSGVTTSGEFIGGGSDLRNLQGTHLVSYSSHSQSSNSSMSISGISTYNSVGILTGSFAMDINDAFGSSVATSADGKTVVVGAAGLPGSTITGSDGLPGTPNTGLVYVFDRGGNSFNQVGILIGSNTGSNDAFGGSVAISADGKTIVVGAPVDETTLTDTGLVYVFDRIGNSFNQVGVLTGSNAVNGSENFGFSVATSSDGKTIIVGAKNDGFPTSTNTGLVYVFDRIGNSFNQVGILTGSNSTTGDTFGFSVSTSADGKTIVVGATTDELPTSTNTGLVYIFDRNGNSFNQVGILTGSNSASGDKFGNSIATSADGKTIVVGVPEDELISGNTGLAYVYDRNENSFNQVGILTGFFATSANDNFANSVAISADGKTIVAGAWQDEPGASDVRSGIVYVFNRIGNTFNSVGTITGSFATEVVDNFGFSVAVAADGKSIIVGAVNDETLSGPGEYGLVYVFDEVRQTYLHSNPQGNIGIGTSNPTSKLQVLGGDIRVGINTSQGMILTSPDGTKYRLIVANGGTLSTVVVP
jgi:hypothetical protein